MLSAKIALETGERNARPEAADVSLEPAIAVVQIESATDAKKFYVDFLGFSVDWGWSEADDERSVYAQICRSGVTLHLSTHGADRRSTELFIRMSGLTTLHAELSSKANAIPLTFRQTPDDRRELQVTDPFGNRLRFSENNRPGTSNR
jgi:hypothetical protein